jgi:hypothetical protein
MYLFYKHIKNKKVHIFLISFIIFISLNLIENVIHFNIGHNSEADSIKLYLPTTDEWVKIIAVMFIFAFLQGMFTYWLD